MDMTPEYSNDSGDYNNIRVETITLTHAASNSAFTKTTTVPGVYVQFTVAGKIVRMLLLSVQELATASFNEAQIKARVAELMVKTPIGENSKKQTVLHLDPDSAFFAAAVTRVSAMALTASHNFVKELESLTKLYDSFTRATVVAALPAANAFHLAAAFTNAPLLALYRRTYMLPENTNPMLTAEARAVLVRFNVPSSDIPDYDPARLAAAHAPLAFTALHDAPIVYATELNVILSALHQAAQSGQIAPIGISEQLKLDLSNAVASARQNQP